MHSDGRHIWFKSDSFSDPIFRAYCPHSFSQMYCGSVQMGPHCHPIWQVALATMSERRHRLRCLVCDIIIDVIFDKPISFFICPGTAPSHLYSSAPPMAPSCLAHWLVRCGNRRISVDMVCRFARWTDKREIRVDERVVITWYKQKRSSCHTASAALTSSPSSVRRRGRRKRARQGFG